MLPGSVERPTTPTIRSLPLDVEIETDELVPDPEPWTADRTLGSNGEAVLAPLTEKTSPLMPSTLFGALKVTVSPESGFAAIAYQHSTSPPLDVETVPLEIQLRPLVSDTLNDRLVVSVYSQA
jgi:hypothetical protein